MIGARGALPFSGDLFGNARSADALPTEKITNIQQVIHAAVNDADILERAARRCNNSITHKLR
jgi:hypothetical protein